MNLNTPTAHAVGLSNLNERVKENMENIEMNGKDIVGMIHAFAETQNELSPGNELAEQSVLKIPPEEQEKMRSDHLITEDEIQTFLSSVEKMTSGT